VWITGSSSALMYRYAMIMQLDAVSSDGLRVTVCIHRPVAL